MDAMSQFGISYCDLEQSGVISPVVSVSCQYKAVRLDFEYEMTDSSTGELRTKGTSTHCFLDREGHVISMKHDYPAVDASFRKMMQ